MQSVLRTRDLQRTVYSRTKTHRRSCQFDFTDWWKLFLSPKGNSKRSGKNQPDGNGSVRRQGSVDERSWIHLLHAQKWDTKRKRTSSSMPQRAITPWTRNCETPTRLRLQLNPIISFCFLFSFFLKFQNCFFGKNPTSRSFLCGNKFVVNDSLDKTTRNP